MHEFVALFRRLDGTTRITDRVEALRAYFENAPPGDAAWVLALLIGRRPRRGVSPRQLRDWVGERTGLPAWLVDASYEAVGDLSETIALLVDNARGGRAEGAPAPALSVARLMEEVVAPLAQMPEPDKRAAIMQMWVVLSGRDELMLFHKLISGAFRMGVSRGLVVRALSEATGLDAALLDHRLLRGWEPNEQEFKRLTDADGAHDDHAIPYPFYLASPIEQAGDMGAISDWSIEYKWDGTRVQLIRRRGQTILWSRGNEVITPAFPELVDASRALPDGTVIDGEILAWDDHPAGDKPHASGGPLPFAKLQTRLNRKSFELTLFAEMRVVMMVYDLLEADGVDIRAEPLEARRARLAALVRHADAESRGILYSGALPAATWDDAAALREGARARGAEGLMLKRLGSVYRAGRVRGDWWKWKVDPFTIDAVLIAAQPGTGRRGGLFTDYTFGVWDGGALTPIAKAYSGLTDEEFVLVDDFVRKNTLSRHGPVRRVAPELVFELAFEGIQRSARHKSGLALRFPRMKRRRMDKAPGDADTLETLIALERSVARGTPRA